MRKGGPFTVTVHKPIVILYKCTAGGQADEHALFTRCLLRISCWHSFLCMNICNCGSHVFVMVQGSQVQQQSHTAIHSTTSKIQDSRHSTVR